MQKQARVQVQFASKKSCRFGVAPDYATRLRNKQSMQ